MSRVSAAGICIFIISWQSSCQFINRFRLSAHVTSVKFYPPCDCVPPWYRCRRGLQENRQALEAEERVLRLRGRRSATPPPRGDVRLRAFRRLRSCRGEKGRSRARAPAEKFTVIVSQKTSASKREARAASPGRDSMHAWPLSQFHSVCVLHGRVKMDWTELDWTRTGRDGGQNSEGCWWWCRRWWLFLSTP